MTKTRRKGFPVPRFRALCIFFILFFPTVLPGGTRSANAAEDPDALYRQGEFAEAEKIYAELDMDHPKEIRYRYNRGCAAYRNGDYQGALSAFSSVLRRADNPEIRFKAAYNMGNAAFQQQDYAEAVKHFKQAVGIDPSNGNAGYNLELALRALERQKKEQDRQEESDTKPGEEAKEQGEKQSPRKDGKSEDGDSDKGEPKTQRDQEDQSEREKGDAEGEEGKQSRDQKSGKSDERQPAQPESPEDLSGELKPLQEMGQEEKESKEGSTSMSMIDRKKAEALLENIDEDRSRYMRFLVPEEDRERVKSGKDW